MRLVLYPNLPVGPAGGAQSVRDAAGARTVSDPGGGISFDTMSALQTAINANPSNSIFVATASEYTLSSQFTWNAGKHPRIFFPGAPGTRTITGFGGNFIGFNVDNDGFELYGGTVTGFGNSLSTFQSGVIARGPCTIQDVIFDTNYRGIGHGGLAGDGTNDLVTVNHCEMVNNLFAGAVLSHNSGLPLVFSNNYVFNNNTGGFDQGATASGAKFLHIQNGEFERNHFDSNAGFQLWLDSCEGPVVINDNVCENGDRAGIFYEVSDGGARINNNACIDNGPTESFHHGAQIVVSCSDGSRGAGTGIEIDFNYLDSARYILALFNHDVHPHDNKLIDFHHNQIWIRGSLAAVGGVDSQSTKTLWTTPSNTFDHNDYRVASTSNSNWQWDSGSGSGSAKTWAQWQAFDPDGDTNTFDENSTRTVI